MKKSNSDGSVSTKKGLELVRLKKTKGAGAETDSAPASYIEVISNQLQKEIEDLCLRTRMGGASYDLKVLVRFNFLEARIETCGEQETLEVKIIHEGSQKRSVNLETGVREETPSVSILDAQANARKASSHSRRWIEGMFNRIVEEKAASIELVLFFRHAELTGRREILNAQI